MDAIERDARRMRRSDGGWAAGGGGARPFTNSFRRRSSAPKRSGLYRRGGYYGRYNRSAQIRRVRRGLKVEKKFFDTALAFNVDTLAEVPATGQLNLIPQGVTESTRVGRQCTVKSLQVRYTITYTPAADTVGAANAWVYLVLDKQANGAAAAVTDVMTSTDFNVALLNLANSQRFKIIRRWSHSMQSGAGVSGAFGKDLKTVDEFIKTNKTLEFSSTTGAITELKSYNYFLMAGCSGAAVDDEVSVTGAVRLRFTDM